MCFPIQQNKHVHLTEDLDPAIVAALITAHGATHAPGHAAKVEKVKRPTIVTAAGSSEEWAYFESRWSEYVDAIKVTGRNKVVQLLECCDEPHAQGSNKIDRWWPFKQTHRGGNGSH